MTALATPERAEAHLELVPALDDPDATRARSRRGRGRPGRRGARGARGRSPVAGPAEALRTLDRRRAPPDSPRGAGARAAEGRRRRGGEAKADRVEPQARHVDHPQLHEGRRAAPRSDPGGQPRPHPRRREVRLQDGLQAFDVRDLVDPPVGYARARRSGPNDPPAGPRRRAGAPPSAHATSTCAEVQPRADASGACERVGIWKRSGLRTCWISSRCR